MEITREQFDQQWRPRFGLANPERMQLAFWEWMIRGPERREQADCDLGPIQFGRGQHQVFLGRDISEERNYSEEVASKIDAEVRKIIETSYETGKRILTDNWNKVERMVASLLEYETVEAEEVKAILDGRPYDRERNAEVPPQPQSPGRPADGSQRAEKPKLFPPKISPEPA